MNAKKLLDLVEKLFYTKLEKKTGWGRNEIKQAFRDSVTEAVLELSDFK